MDAELSHLTKGTTIAVDDAPVIKDPTNKQFKALSRADWSKSIKKDLVTTSVDPLIKECLERMIIVLSFSYIKLLEISYLIFHMDLITPGVDMLVKMLDCRNCI